MTAPFWPLAINTWGDAERTAAYRVIDSGRLTMGIETSTFEIEFAAYVGSRHAVMVNSGSSANLLAVAVMQQKLGWTLSHGFDAIVPAIAWATTYAPLHQHGYRFRLVDVDARTLNTTGALVRASITSLTRVIVGASILGNPAPLDELRKLADQYGFFFIEDNCESMGARLGSKHCGTFGHIGTFSTFFSHHISTGEGGMLVTDDDQLYELALCLRAHGWTRNLPDVSFLRQKPEVAGDYQFALPGYNLRPTELAAAVGRVQLRRLEEMNMMRLRNEVLFVRLLGGDPRWSLQQPHSLDSYRVPFGFTMVFRSPDDLSRAKARLRAAGIEYRMITGGCFSEHPVAKLYNWSSADGLVNAKHAHHCGLFVGNHPVDLTEQITKMREALK